MNNLKKRFLSGVMGAALIFSAVAAPMTAGATKGPEYESPGDVSLGDSHYGLSGLNTEQHCGYVLESKYSTSGTFGYSGYHYVRAYVGGTNKGPDSSTIADTSRVYSMGDIEATAETEKVQYPTSYTYPWSNWRAYAKYGGPND